MEFFINNGVISKTASKGTGRYGSTDFLHILKQMLTRLNVDYTDACCPDTGFSPLRLNNTTGNTESFDYATKTYVVVAGGGGSTANAYREITAPTTIVLGTDGTINATGAGAFTQPLPASATGNAGKIFQFKNSSAGTVILSGSGGQLIDGAATKNVLTTENYQVQSTGTGFIIL